MPGISQPSELAKRVLDRPFTFHEQPVPIPAEYRTKWRVALLLLLLGACRGRRARWHQLHVLNWASRSTANEHAFERLKNGESRPEDAVVRYDPSLDRAIDFALFARLLERHGGDVLALSARGLNVLEALRAHNILSREKAFLSRVAPVSERLVDSLLARKRQ